MPQKTHSLTPAQATLSANPSQTPDAASQPENNPQGLTNADPVQVLDSVDLLSAAGASADELMDSVFEDVDYMLDKGVSIVPRRKTATYHDPSEQDGLAQGALAQGTVHQGEGQNGGGARGLVGPGDALTANGVELSLSDQISEQLSGQALDLPLYDGSDSNKDSLGPDGEGKSRGVDAAPSSSSQEWGRAVRFAIPIVGACATLGLALVIGFILYSPSSPFNRGAIAGGPIEPPGDTSQTEFANYMERALATISGTESDQNGRSTDQTSELASGGQANGGDTNSTASFPSAPGRSRVTIPERVYIPVYQPPSPSLSTLPSASVQDSLSSLPEPEADSSSASAPTPSSAPASAIVPPESVAALPSTTPTPAAPVPVAPPSPTNSASASSAPVLSDLNHDHVLVGLLQLGDRSVAMFDFAEGTHRVKVGEQIGNSGWSLVSVSQNEAVIRRNGDVRSIYIGQSF